MFTNNFNLQFAHLLFFDVDNDDTFHVTNFLLVFKWYIYNMFCNS